MPDALPIESGAQAPALLTPLQEHQQRTADKAKNNDLIAIHGMGSGKTLTSIAILHGLGQHGTVLTPAPLVTNYQKEINKHVDGGLPADVVSINTATKRKQDIPLGDTLVIDEAQGVRNAGTGKGQYAWRQAQRAGRVVLLTGTPVYNNVADIAPLLNMVHREKVLPTNPSEFQRIFVKDKIMEPGFWGKLWGVKPGVAQELTNTERLRELMRNHVDYYANRVNYPDVQEERVSVPFGQRQDEIYRTLEGSAPFWVKYKIRNNLPPTKQEAQQLNAFLTGVRQASLSVKPYVQDMSMLQAAKESPKIMRAVQDIADGLKKNPDFKAFSYSNYLDAGLLPMSAALHERNIPHAVFHGGLSQKEKQQLVDQYNRGELKALLGSSSAAEGLDLKGTRLLQVLEPHFNNSKIRQVVGRAARYGSHAALPEDQRNVLVKYYQAHAGEGRGWLSRLFSGNTTRADQYMDERAAEKDRLFAQMENLWKEEGSKAAAIKEVVLATSNKRKLDHLKSVLNGVITPVKLQHPQAEETGGTFVQNARIKARAAARRTGKPALAEDSGLCVDHLDGAPGVHTKRWTGGTEAENVQKLLNVMRGVKNRRARFTSAIAYATPDGKVRTWESSTEGRILDKPADGKLTWDAVFYSLGLAGAQSGVRKSKLLRVSSLGRAARKAKDFLENGDEAR